MYRLHHFIGYDVGQQALTQELAELQFSQKSTSGNRISLYAGNYVPRFFDLPTVGKPVPNTSDVSGIEDVG
jgi:hypothetical protein